MKKVTDWAKGIAAKAESKKIVRLWLNGTELSASTHAGWPIGVPFLNASVEDVRLVKTTLLANGINTVATKVAR